MCGSNSVIEAKSDFSYPKFRPDMSLIVNKTSKLVGKIKVPPSKSYTHRAVIIASMNGDSRIFNPLFCDDTAATFKACRSLGAEIRRLDNYWDIKGFNGKPIAPDHEINLQNSGTTLRFITSIAALADGRVTLTGEDSLLTRPNDYLVDTLTNLGIKVRGRGEKQTAPLIIEDGKISGGEIRIRGDTSSQFISSLLIACPRAEKDTTIKVIGNLVSKPYIEITLEVLKKAGIKIEADDNFRQFFIPAQQEFGSLGDYEIHGDYSSAAFIMAAACLVNSNVRLTDLVNDKQGDKRIIEILREMGAEIKKTRNTVHINGPFQLEGIEINCCKTPDLVPVLTILGVFAKGRTRIYDIAHLRAKESDRISSLTQELSKLNVSVEDGVDEIIVKNSKPVPGAVFSHNDHRIAMALSLIGLKMGGITIENSGCITKSYPTFINDMKSLRANIELL